MKKSFSEKTILKEAGSLLIAAILVFTAIFVFTPMIKVAKAETVLGPEGFEGTTFPPAGWTKSGTANVVQSTGGKIGTYAARMYCYGYGYWGELDTSTFNGLGGSLTLTFWHKQLVWAGDQDMLYIYATNDSGATYTFITNYASSMNWTYETINLDAFITPSATMQVTFYASCDYGYGVYIDDVEITSGAPGNDYEMTSINTPVTGPASGAVTPEVTVTNLGSESVAGVPVTLTIEKKLPDGGTIPEYNQIVSVDFDPNQTKVITFPDWTPADWQLVENANIEYMVCAHIESPTDPNPINDDKCESITLHYPYLHDVGITGIISPTNGPMQTYPVEVTVENFGTYAETDVHVNVAIETGGVPQYDQTGVIDNIDAGESKNVVFPSWMPADFGPYNVTATIITNDSYVPNDYWPEAIYVLDAAPNVPTKPVGSNEYVCISSNYGTSTTDPDGDNVRYGWDWDDGSPIEWSGWYSSGDVCHMPHSWNDPGTYHVRVKAKHNWSSESDWSPPGDIVISNHYPNIPSNPNPTDGISNVDINANLSWTGGDLDSCDTVTYYVFFGTSSSPPLVKMDSSTTTYNPPGAMSYNQKYYWKIVAWDNHGASRDGPIWSFTTQINQPPYAPSNPSPANNTNNASISTDCLSWVGGGDPEGDPVTYDFYFLPYFILDAPDITGLTTTQFCPQGGFDLHLSTNYFWKIVAHDNHGNSVDGPVWNFKTNDPPNIPSSPNPGFGTTNVSVDTNLSWTGGDPNTGDIVTYDVYFGMNLNTNTKVSANQTVTYYNPPGNLSYSAYYFWKIVAWDNHGASSSSPTGSPWHFQTHMNYPPYKPSLPIPNNNALNVSGANTVLSWKWVYYPYPNPNPDPDQGDTVKYDVYLGFVPDGMSLYFANYSGTSYPLVTGYNTHYYWQIVAWDNHGASTAGPIWNFYTHTNNPPYQPQYPTPANHASGVCTCDNYLSWKWYNYQQFPNPDPDQGDTVKYDVYLCKHGDQMTRVAYHISARTWSPPEGLKMGTTYDWYVVAYDNHGVWTQSPYPYWTFITLSPFSVTVAVTENNKKIQVNITNKVNQVISNANVWMNFTNLASPVSCVSPYLNTSSTQFTQTPPGSGKWYWTGKIPLDGKKLSVKIDGGCANFDVSVTVNSCSDNNVRGVTQVIKQGHICDLIFC